MSEAVIRPAGDSALLVEFENEISLEVNSRVRALKYTLEQSPFEGMGELVPAYRSLLICYNPLKIRAKAAQEEVRSRLGHMDKVSMPKAIVTEIPVCYDKEYAVDLEHIAQLEHKSEEEVIRKLIENGQIATQYVDLEGNVTNDVRFNPNNSYYAVEGITSADGRVFGKMGHSERSGEDLYVNVPDKELQDMIFKGAVDYFR